MAGRAAELMRKVEDDLGNGYELYSERGEAYKKAAEMLAAEGDHEQANVAKIEWLVFAFRETEALGTGGYFGPRYTRPDGVPFPDFYALPPHTRDYLKARAQATTNPLHKARYADFLWDKFRDTEVGPLAVRAYIDCLPLHLKRGDTTNAFRAARRACHLAVQFRNRELQMLAKDAAVRLIQHLVTVGELGFVPRVGEAFLGVAELLTPEEAKRIVERLEQVRASFVSVRDYHQERGTLKVLRELYRLAGDPDASRRAGRLEGESYEAEGDYKLKLDGSGGGPVVAAHFYQLALTHFLELKEADKVTAVQEKLSRAHAQAPTNYQQFVEGLRGNVPGGPQNSN